MFASTVSLVFILHSPIVSVFSVGAEQTPSWLPRKKVSRFCWHPFALHLPGCPIEYECLSLLCLCCQVNVTCCRCSEVWPITYLILELRVERSWFVITIAWTGFGNHMNTLTRTHVACWFSLQWTNSWAMNTSKTRSFCGHADTGITTQHHSDVLTSVRISTALKESVHLLFRHGQVSPYQRQASFGDPQQFVREKGTNWPHSANRVFCRVSGTEPPVGQSSWYSPVYF